MKVPGDFKAIELVLSYFKPLLLVWRSTFFRAPGTSAFIPKKTWLLAFHLVIQQAHLLASPWLDSKPEKRKTLSLTLSQAETLKNTIKLQLLQTQRSLPSPNGPTSGLAAARSPMKASGFSRITCTRPGSRKAELRLPRSALDFKATSFPEKSADFMRQRSSKVSES